MAGEPLGLLLALTNASGGDGTPIGLLLALTVTGTPVPAVPDTGGPGGPMVGGYFSRGRWHNLKETIRLEHEVRERATQAKRKKERDALERAAMAAAKAIEEAQASEAEVQASIARLELALNAAATAATTSQAIAEANHAYALAMAILKQIEDERDDEDAVLLLN